MSNTDDISNTENSKQPDFLYDYGSTTIYKNQYAKKINPDGYIKMPFKITHSVANPNLVISSTNTKCETTNLYIFKNIHKIKETKEPYDGELIIEHEPVTNSYEKIYVCFLLKTDITLGKTNVLDKIINDTIETSAVVNLNKLIPKNSKYIMNDKANVFICTTPITIISDFEKFKDILNSDEKKFAYMPDSFVTAISSKGTQDIEVEEKNEGFSLMKYREGLALADGDNTYLECSMNGASDDSQVVTTTIDSNFNKIRDENNALVKSTSLMSIIVVGLLSFFVIPPIYKMTFIKIIRFANSKGAFTDVDEIPGSLKSLDIAFVILSLIFSGILISTASSVDETSGGTAGPIYAGTAVLTVITIGSVVMYMKKKTEGADYALGTYADIEMNVVFFKSLFNTLWEKKFTTISFILLMIGFYSIIFAPMYSTGVYNIKVFNFLMSVCILFSIPIILLASYYFFLKDV